MESKEGENNSLEGMEDVKEINIKIEDEKEINIKMEDVKEEEVVNEEGNEIITNENNDNMDVNEIENIENLINEDNVKKNLIKETNDDDDDDEIVEIIEKDNEEEEEDDDNDDEDLEWKQMEIPEEWKPLPILLVKKIPKDCTEDRLRMSFVDVGIDIKSIAFNTINESPGFIKAYVRLHPMPIPWEKEILDNKCEGIKENKEIDSWERAKYIAEKLNKEKSLKINEQILYIEANEERVIIYITHLSKELQSDKKLREVMSKFGKVERCFVIKNKLGESKDYAFVEFSLPHVALKVKDILDKEASDGFNRILRNRNQESLSSLHDSNSEVNEKKELKITANSKKIEEKKDDENIKDNENIERKDDNEKEFKGNVEIKMDHDCDQLAKLLYDNASSNDRNLKNKIIRAEWAWPTTIASLFSKLLYVSNLSVEAYTYTSKTKKILDEFGKLIHLNVMRSKITIHEKAFAFIEYKKFSEADKAFRALNEVEHYFLGFPIIAFVNPAKISIEKRHAVRYVQTRDRLYELSPQPRFSVQGNNNRLSYGNTGAAAQIKENLASNIAPTLQPGGAVLAQALAQQQLHSKLQIKQLNTAFHQQVQQLHQQYQLQLKQLHVQMVRLRQELETEKKRSETAMMAMAATAQEKITHPPQKAVNTHHTIYAPGTTVTSTTTGATKLPSTLNKGEIATSTSDIVDHASIPNNELLKNAGMNNNLSLSLAMSSSPTSSLAPTNKYLVTKQNNSNGQQSEYQLTTHPTYSDPNHLSQMMYNQNNSTSTSYYPHQQQQHPHPHPHHLQIPQSHSFMNPSPYNMQHGYNVTNMSYNSGTNTTGQSLQSNPSIADVQSVSMKRDATYLQSTTNSFSYPQPFSSQAQHFSTIKRTRFEN